MSIWRKIFGSEKKTASDAERSTAKTTRSAARRKLDDLIPGGMPSEEYLVRRGNGNRILGRGGRDGEFIESITKATYFSDKALEGIALLHALIRNNKEDAEFIISKLMVLASEGLGTDRGKNSICALTTLRSDSWNAGYVEHYIEELHGLKIRFEIGVRTRAGVSLFEMQLAESDLYQNRTD
jgi:hypothetical protein